MIHQSVRTHGPDRNKQTNKQNKRKQSNNNKEKEKEKKKEKKKIEEKYGAALSKPGSDFDHSATTTAETSNVVLLRACGLSSSASSLCLSVLSLIHI